VCERSDDRAVPTARVLEVAANAEELTIPLSIAGSGHPDERERIRTRISETRETYEVAATLYAMVRKQGVTLTLADCVLAALAREHDVPVVTHDTHVDAFGDPARYQVVERPRATTPVVQRTPATRGSPSAGGRRQGPSTCSSSSER